MTSASVGHKLLGGDIERRLMCAQRNISWVESTFSLGIKEYAFFSLFFFMTVGTRTSHLTMSLGHSIIYMAFSGRRTISRDC